MRILVTGSCGMLGSRLCELLTEDYDLYGCDRRPPEKELNYFFDQIDLTNVKALKRYINAIQPEAIFHLAAKTQVDDCELKPEEAFAANSQATRNLLEASRGQNPAFFYISTDYVFNGKKKTPYRTTDPLCPMSVYGRTKAEGEKWVRKLSSRGIIVRTSWLYGPDGYNFVDTILNAASEKKELKIVSDQIGRPTYTRDLAAALVSILKKVSFLSQVPYGTYHCTNQGMTSWFGFAKKILRFANLKNDVLPISTEELNRPASRPRFSILDLGPLKKAWGIVPRPWEEGLKDFLREKGILYV